MRFILALVLVLLAAPAMAGTFEVSWVEVVWAGGPVRYEIGIGTESRVYRRIEPSTDGHHIFDDLDVSLECVDRFVAVRTCPADLNSIYDCSPWSYELVGLPTITHGVFCVVPLPPTPLPARIDID